MSIRNQPLTEIGSYQVCVHAKRRMRDRLIRESEFLYTLDGPESIGYETYADRTIVYNSLTGISIILDNFTGIIITVTETDERRQRMRLRKKLAYECGMLGPKCHRPPLPIRCA